MLYGVGRCWVMADGLWDVNKLPSVMQLLQIQVTDGRALESSGSRLSRCLESLPLHANPVDRQ